MMSTRPRVALALLVTLPAAALAAAEDPTHLASLRQALLTEKEALDRETELAGDDALRAGVSRPTARRSRSRCRRSSRSATRASSLDRCR